MGVILRNQTSYATDRKNQRRTHYMISPIVDACGAPRVSRMEGYVACSCTVE